MAKKTRSRSRSMTFAPSAPARTIVVSAPSRAPSRRRRSGGGGAIKKHFGRKSGGTKLPVTGVALGGAIVGYAQAKGYLDKLPVVMGSKMATLGIIGWAATKYVKNPTVKLAGLAAIAVAAHDFGRKQGGGVSGDDATDGDEDI